MMREFRYAHLTLLLAAFALGALLTAYLLPGPRPDSETQIYKSRIRELEAGIAKRDKTVSELAVAERKLSMQMRLSGRKTAAIEAASTALSQKTALARKELAASKKRGMENEPVFSNSPDDNDLVNRLDRLLAGMGIGKGKAG